MKGKIRYILLSGFISMLLYNVIQVVKKQPFNLSYTLLAFVLACVFSMIGFHFYEKKNKV